MWIAEWLGLTILAVGLVGLVLCMMRSTKKREENHVEIARDDVYDVLKSSEKKKEENQ